MKRKNNKRIYFTLFMITIFLNAKITKASIIDDIVSLFGFGNSEKVATVIDESSMSTKTEKDFDENQMEVVVIIDEIFNDIKNVDVNSLKNNLNYDIGKNDLNDIESFFENNNDDKKNMQYIFKDLRYDIEDINVSDDTAKVRIQYTLPSIKELILKIIPKVVMKNFGTFFDNGITNNVASYVIESIKNELQSGSIKNELYVYDFSFKKVENKWVLSDVDTLIKDATEYIRSSLVLVH